MSSIQINKRVLGVPETIQSIGTLKLYRVVSRDDGGLFIEFSDNGSSDGSNMVTIWIGADDTDFIKAELKNPCGNPFGFINK